MVRPATIVLFLLAGLAGLPVASGADPHRAGWLAGVDLAVSPAPRLRPARAVWSEAEALAARLPGATTLCGVGDSMRPLYPPRTVLVVAPQTYGKLRPGQTVVYWSARGRPVAHVLVSRSAAGWRAAGLNNRRPDRDRVRAENLIGVVVAAFAPLPGADSAEAVLR